LVEDDAKKKNRVSRKFRVESRKWKGKRGKEKGERKRIFEYFKNECIENQSYHFIHRQF
jgi:hypothetical protein